MTLLSKRANGFLMAVSAGLVPAQAAILAYDGFDTAQYVAGGAYGAPVYGTPGSSNALIYDPSLDVTDGNHTAQNPPTHGFGGEWRHLDSVNQNAYGKVLTSTLTYSGMQTTPGSLSISRTTGSASIKRFERDLSIGTSKGYTETLYVAGLIQPSAGTAFSVKFYYAPADRSFEFSVDADGLTALAGNSSGSASTAPGLWTAGAANLFVLKLENAVLSEDSELYAGDRISLYINPDLSSEASNSAALAFGTATSNFYVTGNTGYTLSTMRLTAAPGPNSSVIFDELKITTTWEELSQTVVIPEPSAAVLMLLGLLPFRRKR
jgi:hypothetical protein